MYDEYIYVPLDADVTNFVVMTTSAWRAGKRMGCGPHGGGGFGDGGQSVQTHQLAGTRTTYTARHVFRGRLKLEGRAAPGASVVHMHREESAHLG